jgi:putative hydrolase of the HAD superfamily
MTKALLFDLGNVLIGFDFARGYRAMQAICGHTAEEIRRMINHAELVHPYERGEISSGEFYQRLCGVLSLKVSYRQFCDLWSKIFLPEPLLPVELLAALRRRYRMVLVSNTNDIHFEMIRRQHEALIRHFDARVLSYCVGASKPSERIYQEAVRQAQCDPGECFFTDDMPEFVEAARRYGIDAVQFQGYPRLQQELRKRGINWDGV